MIRIGLRGWSGQLYVPPHPCSGLYGGLSVFVDRQLRLICFIIVLSVLSFSAYPSSAGSPSPPPEQTTVASKTLRLSLNEALGLFVSQNLDVLIAKYGIEYTKGQEVTARLFPNPLLSVGTLSSYTQGRTLSNSGQLFTQVAQLFELAGKRGYRIESAGFGTQSAEAAFEDAVRLLGLTVKDSYYRVQLAQRRLMLAEENRERFIISYHCLLLAYVRSLEMSPRASFTLTLTY